LSLAAGRASAGEVEDYEWLFTEPTAVTLTDFNVENRVTKGFYLLLLFVLTAFTFIFKKIVGRKSQNQ